MWNWLTWDVVRWIGGGALVLAALSLARIRGQFVPHWPGWLVRSGLGRAFDRVLPGGLTRMVVGWLLLALLVAGGVMTGLLWLLGWPSLPPGAAFTATQLLELLKIALAVVAGLGGVVLLAVNLRKQRVAEQEHELAVERGEREKTQAFNERFGAAAEQLAHASSAVRLAGVYAMAGPADDWSAKNQVCVDVLCGYLRLSTEPDAPGEAEVRAAILQVIREHTASRASGWTHLDFDFSGVTFENADFSGLTFEGSLVLDRADFTGALCSFEDTAFSGTLSCHGTDFLAERTTFANATFEHARAEFVGARFAGVADFSRIDLSSIAIDFYRVDFSEAKVDFSRATVRGGTLRFVRCDFVSAELDLSRANGMLYDDEVATGRITMQRCRFEESTVDLRDGSRSPLLFWIVRSRFDRVEFPGDRSGDAWLNLRDCELVGGTEIPEGWLRVRHASSR
ncbi:pentapeptide repeat-containing protein [Amycolatopsis albispora]|uniref:Pentapeptide repeat-containing protein n=1 Tax=Amycolatopsis albispora TaxID=1804986 RepID=A0A344LE89_9PSEU|nr:pentapeptide repeat-containing protein [Amycolatopsis albispora]AXB46363.1 hypothetical protein A4R43_31120 [Amycolatopsis albispora]